MRYIITAVTLLIITGKVLAVDQAKMKISGNEATVLNADATDVVRENLIHLFDTSQYHQMEGGSLPVKQQGDIQIQLGKITMGSYLLIELEEPARIVVERKVIRAKRLWVKIRESDGWVHGSILQQPNGDLVSLAKPSGDLMVRFAPYILSLIKSKSEQVAAPDGE